MAAQAEHVSPARVFARSTAQLIWIGPKQEAALNHFAGKALLKVVLGPASSGKTTLLRHFQYKADDTVVLLLSGPQRTAVGVLSTLLAAAQLGPWNLAEVEQRNLLTVFMQQRCMQGKRIVVCVDNVSRFTDDAWSEVERLRALAFANKPLVELAIVGTEADTKRAPLDRLLEGSTSAIEATHYLSAPTDEDIARYIDWRLGQFGVPNDFSGDAYPLINCVARGRFSFVNLLCQAILMEQLRAPSASIDAGTVNRAAATLTSVKAQESSSDTVELKRLEENESHLPVPEGRLIVSCKGKVLRTVDLNGRLLIGRGDDNDICLRDRYLSRHHAVILPTPEGQYFIVDLNSTNGVLVNGKLVDHTFLYDQDVVRLCQFTLKVELDEADGELPATFDLTADDSDDDTDTVPAATETARPVRAVEQKAS